MRFILASIVAEVLPYVVCFFAVVAGLFFESFYIAGFVLLLGLVFVFLLAQKIDGD
jgi:hypothetical protein